MCQQRNVGSLPVPWMFLGPVEVCLPLLPVSGHLAAVAALRFTLCLGPVFFSTSRPTPPPHLWSSHLNIDIEPGVIWKGQTWVQLLEAFPPAPSLRWIFSKCSWAFFFFFFYLDVNGEDDSLSTQLDWITWHEPNIFSTLFYEFSCVDMIKNLLSMKKHHLYL